MEKKIYAIGNWKMYKTSRQATDYIEELASLTSGCQTHIYLAVPFTSIATAAEYAKNTPISIGAQNMHDASEGAFTGEIASLMLKEAGAQFVLLGHSERRHFFHEKNDLIQKKVKRALSDDLQPILCVGETKHDREKGQEEEILHQQLTSCLEGLSAEQIDPLIVAYEPVWAIGTGQTASPSQIHKAHHFCRKILCEVFGSEKGPHIPILYGGSVKSENVHVLMQQKDVNGVLVGGASLEAAVFAKIIHECEKNP